MAFTVSTSPLLTERLLPNLFLLGNPKSGSTFLFGCLRGAFDPNLLCGPQAQPGWRSCEHAHVLTTLGSKKEFNFWGGAGWHWGWDWYAGPSLPLRQWEWREQRPKEPAGARRWRRGENRHLTWSESVAGTCMLDANASAAAAAPTPRGAACSRFPLECLRGARLVRPGCGLMRPLPTRRMCEAAGGARACALPRVYMSHAWPRRAEASARAYALDPSINTFMAAPDAPRQMADAHAHLGSFGSGGGGDGSGGGVFGSLGRLGSSGGADVGGAPSSGPGAVGAVGAVGASASSLRFVVLLREPIARAVSSVRMMREWRWEAANGTDALSRDTDALLACASAAVASSAGGNVAGLQQESPPRRLRDVSGAAGAGGPTAALAAALPHLADAPLRALRHCLARGAPLNHVRAAARSKCRLGGAAAGHQRLMRRRLKARGCPRCHSHCV